LKRILFFGSFILILLFLVLEVHSEVIFLEHFDNIVSGWNCDDPVPDGWTSKSNCGIATYGGVTHYCGEISAGGVVGNSLKSWKQGTNFTQYCGILSYDFAAHYREIYTRWYMKIPSGFDTTGFMNFLKLWRMNFTHGEVYLNFNGSSFSTASFEIGNAGCNPAWYTILGSGQIPRDDQWHCWEVQIKMGTTGSKNSVIQMWLDGVLKYQNNGANLCTKTGDYFTKTGLGIGNTGAAGFQAPWRAIEFDGFVLSTTYVGPGDEALPPKRPKGIIREE
jgi:hypothetical protein